MNLFQKFKKQEILNQIPKGTVVAAVSGGADSVALLHLIHRCSLEKEWKPVVVHVQHGLRGKESLRDQIFVQNLSQKFSLPFSVISISVKKYSQKNKIGIEESARILRYETLAKTALEIGAKTLLVAHTANDQAETFFLNLLRGSGTDGLVGILSVRTLDQITGKKNHSNIQLIRPLLSFSRDEIIRYLYSQNLKFCKDSMNEVLKYRRNWVRKKLIPLIQKVQPKIVKRISNLTEIFQMEKEQKEKWLKKIEKKVIVKKKESYSPFLKINLSSFFRYDLKLRYDFLHRLLPDYSYERIKQTDAFLKNVKYSGKKFFRIDQFFATKKNSEKPQIYPDFYLKVPGENLSNKWNLKVKIEFLKNRPERIDFKKKRIAYFDKDKCKNHKHWQIRGWKAGDKFMPFGMRGTKKVQDFFTDQKISKEERVLIPILEINHRIAWIIGYRTDNRLKIDSATKKIIKVEVQKLAPHKNSP